MAALGSLSLALALAAFLIFFGNVALGALRMTVFLSDVAEMLTLLAASMLFTAGALCREAQQKNKTDGRKDG